MYALFSTVHIIRQYCTQIKCKYAQGKHLNYVYFINRLHSNYVLYYNHSKGQESCDRWTGREPEDLSKISRPTRGLDGCDRWTGSCSGCTLYNLPAPADHKEEMI